MIDHAFNNREVASLSSPLNDMAGIFRAKIATQHPQQVINNSRGVFLVERGTLHCTERSLKPVGSPLDQIIHQLYFATICGTA